MSTILANLKYLNIYVLYMGNFIANCINISRHIPIYDFVELMFSYSFFLWSTAETSSTLIFQTKYFVIFSSKKSKCFNGIIIYSDVSDHFPIFTISTSKKILNETEYVFVRYMSPGNKTTFRNKIKHVIGQMWFWVILAKMHILCFIIYFLKSLFEL